MYFLNSFFHYKDDIFELVSTKQAYYTLIAIAIPVNVFPEPQGSIISPELYEFVDGS